MDTSVLLKSIKKDVFGRQDIIDSAITKIDGFKETDIRNLLEKMMKRGEIVRVAHNRYVRKVEANTRYEYIPQYSETARKLIADVEEKNPYVDFQVWELAWFNEFLVHLVARNMVFLDVENRGCEFIYSSISDDYQGRMLLLPEPKEIQYYSQPDEIIIERLISESPKIKERPHETPIEKLIVELFANKILRSMVSQGDYANVLETIFEKYSVDQLKMFRYARRRNKKDEVRSFIEKNTDIKLLKEV